jgi:ribosomal protein L31E
LSELKESYPIEVAEYAVDNKIASEATFAWWVPHVLQKRDCIIKKVNKCYWKQTHKYGIKIPKSIEEALKIDKRMGTDFWWKVIEKEMRNVQVAFDIQEDGKVPVNYTQIECHMVFDIKLDTLVRKARFVAGGHKTGLPKDSMYSSVVLRDMVRLFFLIVALNDVNILTCNVQDVYVNAKTKEKVWFKGRDEMGQHKDKVIVIVHALYGLKSSSACWR